MFESILYGDIVLNLGYLLAGLAVFIVARMVLKEEETRAAQESLDDARDKDAGNVLVKYLRPFFRQYFVPMVRGKKFWDGRRTKYRRKIISAGLKEEISPDEFIAFKMINILVFPLILGGLKAGEFLDVGLIWIFAAPVVGWFYPDLWVRGRIQERQKKIRKAMPFIVDLLALSTEAGLDFVGAMQKVVEKANSSPLVDEFGQVLKEIKVGSSRADALREMQARVDMPEVGSFIAILISADKMGASIGKILRQQSEQIRNNRFVLAEKAGAAAATKLMGPTVFIILPTVMLLIAAPFAVNFFVN